MASEAGSGRVFSASGAPNAPGAPNCQNSSGPPSSVLGKRKKVRSRRSDFLHNWLEKAAAAAASVAPEPDLFPPPPYHPYVGAMPPPPPLYHQRLFNAASDPTVCRYSSPYVYPPEPLSLPVCAPPYYPFHHAAINSNDFIGNHLRQKNQKQYNYKKNRVPRKNTCVGIENELIKLQNGKSSPTANNVEVGSATPSVTSAINNDFTSLPPVVDHKENAATINGSDETNKSEKRRFSDPGFAQNDVFDGNREDSPEETDSGASSVLYDYNANSRLIMCLVDHINTLKETNRRLHKELHDSRGELDSLKQQLSIWRGDSASSSGVNNNPSGSQTGGIGGSSVMYAPGMLADLVREIRDATRVREEAIFTKVRSIIDEKNCNKNNCMIPQEKYFQDWRSYDQLKQSQHQSTLAEKARTNDRIVKLEEEIYNLRLNPSREGLSPCSSPGFAINGEERIRIQMELHKERTARAAADARVHKLELLVTQLQSKRGSLGGYAPGAPVTPTHSSSLNGFSAANSASSLGISADSRQMLLGPITDL